MLNKFKNSYLSYLLMYNFYYLSWAIFSALISVYLMDKGYKPSEVSLVVSASFLSSMLTQPIIGMISDRYKVKTINCILFALAAIGGLLFMFANNLFTLVIGYSFVLTLLNGTNPIMEKIATASPYAYGKIRIWGTIGYALGSQLAGLIYEYIAPSAIFITFVITMGIAIFGTYFTDPKDNKPKEAQEKTSLFELFSNGKYLYYLVVYAIFTGIISVGNTYIPAMFQSDQLSTSFLSTILSIAVLFELPLVFYSYLFMDKFSNKTLMLIAFSAAVIQYCVYALNLPVPLKIIVTLLFKHPAGMLFIMINLKVVNTLVSKQQQLTALAFCATVKNLSSIAFQNILGTLLDTHTYAYVFTICLGILLIGFVLIILFKVPKGTDNKLFS